MQVLVDAEAKSIILRSGEPDKLLSVALYFTGLVVGNSRVVN